MSQNEDCKFLERRKEEERNNTNKRPAFSRMSSAIFTDFSSYYLKNIKESVGVEFTCEIS